MGNHKVSGIIALVGVFLLPSYSGALASVASSSSASGAAAATGTPAPAASAASINWGAPVFTDNFNGTILGKSWSVYDSPTGKNPRTRDSVRVKGGYLQLIGHHEKPYGDVSGGISDNADRLYGRWEVRFRADAGAGYEPVVLLWPKNNQWPVNGEIDMAEIWDPQRHGAGEFLHLGKDVKHFIGQQIPTTVNFTKWHTIAVDWLPGHVTFWLDGKAQWTVKRGAGRANYVPSTPFHLALQNDAGCANRCKPDKHTPKQVIMDVDWVKVYAVPKLAAVTATAYSPNGGYVATSDARGHVYVWSLPGFKLKRTITDPKSKGVDGLAFTSQSHYVAAADGNGHVYVWTVANGKLNATVADPGSKGVRGVSYSPDGKSMSSADANGHDYIWAEPNYTLTATLPANLCALECL